MKNNLFTQKWWWCPYIFFILSTKDMILHGEFWRHDRISDGENICYSRCVVIDCAIIRNAKVCEKVSKKIGAVQAVITLDGSALALPFRKAREQFWTLSEFLHVHARRKSDAQNHMAYWYLHVFDWLLVNIVNATSIGYYLRHIKKLITLLMMYWDKFSYTLDQSMLNTSFFFNGM
jgi:hypothetical protein